MGKRGDIRIGISGWRYDGWRGTFYPKGLSQSQELVFASHKLNSIELNGSFYSLQQPGSFARWYEETPPDFVFSVKGSRFVTHMKRLLDVETPLANFFAQGLLRLNEKLGPILWQFPPNFKLDLDRFERFISLLPRNFSAAARLAKGHDARLKGRAWFEVERDRRLRYAVEIRNESFVSEEFIELLRRHEIGLVVADTVEWPLLMDLTANLVYCRLHGSEELYASGYSNEAIDKWSHRVLAWANGAEAEDGRRASAKAGKRLKARDVFVYFDNDRKVRAPVDAQALRERIEIVEAEPQLAKQVRAGKLAEAHNARRKSKNRVAEGD